VRDWIGGEERKWLGFHRVAGEHAFYATENQGRTSDPVLSRWTTEISRGHRWLLGRLLSHAGAARGTVWRPARRFLGRRPRRVSGDGRDPVFFMLVRDEQCVLMFFQKQLLLIFV
jgi:hypothetical protein